MQFSFFGALGSILASSGFASFAEDPRSLIMIIIACVLLYMGIGKKFEPLLLVPIAFGMLLANLPLLEEFGFYAEDFGGGALVVRQAPFAVDPGDIEDTLLEIGGRLLTTGRADPAAARDELLHTMACKAAIKGGQRNSPAELLKVAQAVMSGAVKYCPHGRPVAIELTRQQLEKRFGRA